jgi:RNA polymerase sigma-70 factor (ECF subfamily)
MPIADQSEDARIVQRVRAGDVEAFALLVDRHHARCLRVATHLLSDADDAEDAVQEAFVRAYRHLGSYRERDRFGAWLLRVVVNQCRTHAAKHRRWTSSPNIAATDLLANDAGRDAAEARATREELAHALAQLEPAQREAVVLRFADELSYDEMANITGVGVSALKMRVQRACARLRALLSEHFHA